MLRQLAAQGPRLVDLTKGEVYPLPEEGCVSIGQRQDCEVVIPRPGVSGRHCVLTCSPDGVQVEDDERSNGTFVNESQAFCTNKLLHQCPKALAFRSASPFAMVIISTWHPVMNQDCSSLLERMMKMTRRTEPLQVTFLTKNDINAEINSETFRIHFESAVCS
eukprot:s747_g10.t1